jgi:NADPH2:quinone reductase
MKAVQATRFGDPAVLTVVDLPDPVPGPGEVAIDVTHAAVGLIDVFLRQGLYKDRPGMPQPPFVPGLEVAGTVRALGAGVTGFTVGEKVVTMSGTGTGGYASVYVGSAARVASLEGYDIDPVLAVTAVPNAAMAHVALTRVAHLTAGESVLVHGALGGFAAAFPGIARQLGASRADGTADRSHSLDLMPAGGRLLAVGNASGDWGHQLDSNQLWLRSVTVSGYNSAAYLSAHPEAIRPALEAALQATAAGLGEMDVDVLPFSAAATAHERMESRNLNGRIVLTPDPVVP